MTEPRLYTTDEVEQLLKEHTDRLEAKHFEERTDEILKEHNEILKKINVRLNEANGYKATIGRDVKAALDRLDAIDKAAKDKVEQGQRWYQDMWIRTGIAGALVAALGTLIWEVLNIWLSLQNLANTGHPALK